MCPVIIGAQFIYNNFFNGKHCVSCLLKRPAPFIRMFAVTVDEYPIRTVKTYGAGLYFQNKNSERRRNYHKIGFAEHNGLMIWQTKRMQYIPIIRCRILKIFKDFAFSGAIGIIRKSFWVHSCHQYKLSTLFILLRSTIILSNTSSTVYIKTSPIPSILPYGLGSIAIFRISAALLRNSFVTHTPAFW